MTFETSLTFKTYRKYLSAKSRKNENECYVQLYSRYNSETSFELPEKVTFLKQNE